MTACEPILCFGVTGSRYATQVEHGAIVGDALARIARKYKPGDIGRWELYHGAARGVDDLVAEICFARGYCWSDGIHEVKAGWSEHGKAAGPIRNQCLVNRVAAHRLQCPIGFVAFPAVDDYEEFRASGKPTSGSTDCIARAEAADIPLIVVALDVAAERDRQRVKA